MKDTADTAKFVDPKVTAKGDTRATCLPRSNVHRHECHCRMYRQQQRKRPDLAARDPHLSLVLGLGSP